MTPKFKLEIKDNWNIFLKIRYRKYIKNINQDRCDNDGENICFLIHSKDSVFAFYSYSLWIKDLKVKTIF